MTNATFTLTPGSSPLLVSFPHVGTEIPPSLQDRLVPRALATEDTDWHLEALYAFVRAMGAGTIVPRHARYVVDLNRPPENEPMYPGVNNTELCPTRFFSGEPLYREGQTPTEAEIAERVDTYWRPYHDALHAELQRLRSVHGHAVLFDAHSICSVLPWLFDGQLPDLNLGTVNGSSASPTLREQLSKVLQSQSDFTQVVDGRFKGGYITRHYGRPAENIHAIQLEMCWRCYMAEQPPYAIDPARAATLLPVLRALVQTMLDWRPA
ncbi:N-formylglutamate deformylase [Rhodoferax sp. TH121]|uniref:N-formylglutamate deformylase n=1 Tax=Rhodoferax sp. TH121 TaxID=2022803 RepID=UPI000B9739F4|nr:N-formylglutamate deformylase [Rhodoferax sp. TH121]OYQ40899.1 N-formylglutamate deformylase [Rhodoferax sp. TH121]